MALHSLVRPAGRLLAKPPSLCLPFRRLTLSSSLSTGTVVPCSRATTGQTMPSNPPATFQAKNDDLHRCLSRRLCCHSGGALEPATPRGPRGPRGRGLSSSHLNLGNLSHGFPLAALQCTSTCYLCGVVWSRRHCTEKVGEPRKVCKVPACDEPPWTQGGVWKTSVFLQWCASMKFILLCHDFVH